MKKLLTELCRPKVLLFIGPVVLVIYVLVTLIGAHAGGTDGPGKGMVIAGLFAILFLWVPIGFASLYPTAYLNRKVKKRIEHSRPYAALYALASLIPAVGSGVGLYFLIEEKESFAAAFIAWYLPALFSPLSGVLNSKPNTPSNASD